MILSSYNTLCALRLVTLCFRRMSAASMIKENMAKRLDGSGKSIQFDEAMSLMVMMQIMAETGTVIGSLTSSLTRRIYDLLGMIEDHNLASSFKEVDGLSYFPCWRDHGEFGLHKKNKEGKFEYDCIPPSPKPQGELLSNNNEDLIYPEHCQIPKLPPNMKCGSVGFWYW